MTARLRIAADRIRRGLIDAQRHENGGGRPAAGRRKGRAKRRIPTVGTNAGTAGAMS
jgi:hypothetical protein